MRRVFTFESNYECPVGLAFNVSDRRLEHFAGVDDVDLGRRTDSLDFVEVQRKTAERLIVDVDQNGFVTIEPQESRIRAALLTEPRRLPKFIGDGISVMGHDSAFVGWRYE